LITSIPYPWIRVVYSRFIPDWTKPQTGRLNKSPPHLTGACKPL
jgi:hypothetical protein